MSAQHVITVSPPAAPTVSLPAGLPATLDCASADSYSTSDNATYTNSEVAHVRSVETSPTVTNSFDACSGGTITIDYAGTDACGNALSAQPYDTIAHQLLQQLVYQQVYRRLWIMPVPIAIQQVIMLLIRIVRVAHVESVEH